MPAYKDEKSGKWFASFYYKDWDGQSRKKLKRGFETKKEAISYERNFTVKMSGSLNMRFEEYFELYKSDVIGTIRLNTWMTKEHMIRTKILPFFSGMKMSEIKPVVVKKWHNVLLNIENAEGEAYQKSYEEIDIFLKQFPHLRHVVFGELKIKSSKNLFRKLNEHSKKLLSKQEEIVKKHNSLLVQYEELEHLKANMSDYLGRERIANKKSKESIVKQINDIRKIENHSYRRKNKNRNIER